MYDLIVVGSGFCGSVIANLAARDGKHVLLLEKRNHIAGNMYDSMDENGVLVQRYGPHVFHTSNDQLAQYLLSQGEWYNCAYYYGVEIDGKVIPAPFGFRAIDELYEVTEASLLKSELVAFYEDRDSVPIMELLENKIPVVHQFASFLYEKNYLPYALKQWHLKPDQLTDEIIGRMPILLSNRTRYFIEKYEMIPVGGYTAFFKKMLSSSNIEVRLETDALDVITLNEEKNTIEIYGTCIDVPLVWTAPLEGLFARGQKILPYRSLRFEYRQFERADVHSSYTSIGYPQQYDYLRATDYNKLVEHPFSDRTTVGFEYPIAYNAAHSESEPYYPILTSESNRINQALQERARKFPQLYPCGRLADYRYYNMDQAIERAFEVYKSIYGQLVF